MPDRSASRAGDGSVSRLLKSAARQSYDPDVDLDWDAPEVDGLWAMQPERMSLYGTKLWDRLTDDQRKELSKHEVASIASVGLWFEIVLMQVLFLLTEIADECRHSTMFGRAIARHGVPAYGPRPQIRRLAKVFPLIARGAGAYASILIGEEPVDRWQREQMLDERIQPLIRMVSRIHVVEEARHVTFAREELEKSVARMGRTERLFHQTVT
ncbi:MAG: diiron oxygenase, partial [Propionibacteriales bacterium]|nr:diiron oxygenase [Propionibacteriales bacterium]